MSIWTSLFDKDVRLTKNKSFEIQLMFDSKLVFCLEFDPFTWSGTDHAGPSLNIGLLGFELTLRIYDHRHWNDETNAWYTEEEAKAEAEEWNRRWPSEIGS